MSHCCDIKFSIITPCYNSEHYIEKCVKSVISQKYKNIEYIIIDGGSSDKTLEIIKKYKNQIIIISEKDNGNYDAIRKGFEIASGDIISWIDSDNYYFDENVIKNVADAFFNSNSNADLVVTNSYYNYYGSKKLHLINPVKNNLNFKSFLNKGNMLMPECIFFKKEIYTKTGGLNLKYKLLSDYDLWIKIFKLNPVIIKIPLISSVYLIRDNALLRKNFYQAWKETFMIGNNYSRTYFVKIKFYFLYIKSLIRHNLINIIFKNKKIKNFFISTFR